MKVGIVGLGLIGGSMAKAYSQSGEHTVYGYDKDSVITQFAIMSGACSAELTDENIGECDLILIAILPQAAIEFVKEKADKISSHTMVIDLCGTKRVVCESCFPIAKEHGFTFVGGHPMAGTHNAGFKYSSADLFKGAPMVIVPPSFDSIELLEKIKKMLAPALFGSYSMISAEKHDEVIAFTSQMAHVVSNAFIKSPTAGSHKGFSAGSYKDLTRVAWLNPTMWAELFLENKDNLISELDCLIDNLNKYRKAMAEDDFDTLENLLDEGRNRKKEIDEK